MKKSSIIILALILSSCSANYHLRKAIKKNPSIIATDIKVNSIKIETKPVEVSYKPSNGITILNGINTHDTVKITIERLITDTDTVYKVVADCPDNEVVEKTIIKTVTIEKPIIKSFKSISYWLIAVIILSIVFVLVIKLK